MPSERAIEDIYLYRITHIDNIPHLLEHGVTHRNSSSANPDFVNIGDSSLIGHRNSREVRVDNGDLSNEDARTIVLGEFIPFYFGVKMPMLYVIQIGGNFVGTATAPENIVYIKYPLSNILESGINFYFTDGHATDNLTTFYDRSRIEDLPNIIDWNAVKASYWGGHENLNIKRKKQAELILESDLPFDNTFEFGCYNQTSKERLVGMGIEEEKIKVVPNAYY